MKTIEEINQASLKKIIAEKKLPNFFTGDIDHETKDKIGLNYTECTDLILYFKDSKLDAVNYEVKPNSVTTPYQDVEEKNRYLKGFNWRGSEQPKCKEDIFIE